MNKAVLVTGGAGYIGSHACKALARAGYTPVAYDNLSRGHRASVRWGPLVEGDLADRAHLLATMREHGIGTVMHFAALAYVGESMREPRAYFSNNVVNTLTLLDSMLDAKVRHIVFSSSCATYGLPGTLPIAEGSPQLPINAYGETKLAMERAIHWYVQAYGIRVAVLRYFNAAGADPDGEVGEEHDPETHLIPLVLDAALGRHPCVEVYGMDYPTPDGTAVRDYVHVQDLADAHVRAVGHLLGDGESVTLNLGTGRGYSVQEVIAVVERVTGRAVPRRYKARRPGDPPELVANPHLAREVLGWRASMSDLDTIIRTAWAWHTRHV